MNVNKIKYSGIIFMIFILSYGFAQGFGHNSHNGRNHYEDWPDSLSIISVNGTVSVDNSMMMSMYYLEKDGNDSLDYILGFGPWWYKPVSGAVRPSEGEVVSITGGLNDLMVPSMLVVFEINGLVWRDSTDAPPWSGDWIYGNASDTTWVFCPTDSLDHVGFPPLGMNGMMGNMGMMWPDSIYCQFEEIPVDSIPRPIDGDMFEGYLCNFNNDFGGHMSMMGQGNGQYMGQGMMGFNQSVHFQFHYDDINLASLGLDEGSIQLFYIDGDGNWLEETNITIDNISNTINLVSSDVAEYYTLKASAYKVGTDNDNTANVLSNISIESVYPNPFNPSTKIHYSILKSDKITIQIFDINGNFVKEIANEYRNPGKYNIQWDGKNNLGQSVSSGTYIIKISTDNFSNNAKITLLR